ncbi:MAG: hypothetical protein J7619_23020 [Dyadobacter sp.]|uniref:hypothetical protein n=1 Tax=Dyadobacter sp. TaxID=1914288 RepID=UPI001B166196|nr:hypothetical protein [Dyadobacter sp.]MBO9615587.1 hypothetical protein [Dyadobacter sp.]
METLLITDFRANREARHKKIAARYRSLIDQGAMSKVAVKKVMEEFEILDASTVYRIVKKVPADIAKK